MSPYFTDYLPYTWQVPNGFHANSEQRIAVERQQDIAPFLKHYCAIGEEEELLTPTLEAELSAYDRDELTCGAYIILARKKL